MSVPSLGFAPPLARPPAPDLSSVLLLRRVVLGLTAGERRGALSRARTRSRATPLATRRPAALARLPGLGGLVVRAVRGLLAPVVDHHQRELTSRRRHHAGPDVADGVGVTLPSEPGTDRGECRGDGPAPTPRERGTIPPARCHQRRPRSSRAGAEASHPRLFQRAARGCGVVKRLLPELLLRHGVLLRPRGRSIPRCTAACRSR